MTWINNGNFKENLQLPPIDTGMEGTSDFQTPKKTLQVVNRETNVEIIPSYPTSQVVLRIEEIPSLDIFYSLAHKSMIRRQRKKIKVYSLAATPEIESMEVV